ncbi:MAG: hypothetical protein JWN27_2975 [Candidatus Eremiobacteraeota bacterium]|nr:hypothetical protein [Candidatus Eremiobacteraeota bacterium]
MRTRLGRFVVRSAAVSAAFVLAACGGGGGGSTGGTGGSSAVPVGPPKATSALTISGTLSGTGPYVLGGKRRPAGTRGTSVQPVAPTFDHIDVHGTLYAADASATPITNTVTIPPPAGGVYTANVGFSNVTSGNNEWALLEFTGVAADGSKIALGEVGGLVNVGGSNPNTAALNATTTLSLQLFITLVGSGLISTYDIDNLPNLSSLLASRIATAGGITPDPATGVFTAGAMQQLYSLIGPGFERVVSISTNPATPGNFAIVRDYTNASELNLEASLTQFLGDIGIPSILTSNAGSFLLRTSGVLGYDRNCGGFTVDAGTLRLARPGLTVVPADVRPCTVPNPTGSEQVRNVYGGNVMIGATNDPYDPTAPFTQPFLGGWTSVAGRPTGAPPAAVNVAIASTEFTITVNDPFEAAFPFMTAPYGAFPTFGTGAFSATNFHQLANSPDPYRAVELGFTGNQETVVVDTFNPWNVSTANLSLCSVPFPKAVIVVLPACFPLGAVQPITVARTFGDDGSNLSYFNWTLGGAGGTIAPDAGGIGYDVTPNPGTITLTTTTPTALYGRSQLTVFNNLPIGTVWTATVTTSDNNWIHTNHGANVAGCGCGKTAAIIELDDIASTKPVNNITLSVDAGATGFVLDSIFADPSGTSIGGNYLMRRQAGRLVRPAAKRG